VLREYGVDGRLLLAVKSLYSCSKVCVRVGGVESQPFTVSVGLLVCVLSPLLFIVYMNWIDISRRVDEDISLLEAASSEQGLQHALDRFSCDQAGIKTSTN